MRSIRVVLAFVAATFLVRCGAPGSSNDSPVSRTATPSCVEGQRDPTGGTDCVDACTPSCTGRACGNDGCGGSCGTCAEGQTCTASGTCKGIDVARVDAGREAASVRFIGRRDETDPDHPWFGWPGGRVVARFDGTAVDVTLVEQSLYTGPSRWDVLVDGVRTSTLAPSSGTGTYTLASGLPSGTHTIELYRRTEGVVGITQFRELVFPDGGRLLAPPPSPSRRLAFLGDSLTAGYGDECTSPTDPFSGATENERLAFGGLAAHDLGADHHDVSYSGKGVLLNYNRNDLDVFDQLFPRSMPDSTTPAWDSSTFTPDVVWINLGTNDWSQSSPSSTPPDLVAFTNKYLALVATVRSTYPGAHIFCSLPAAMNDTYPAGWNVLTNMRAALANMLAARSAAGDTKFHTYEFTRALPSDTTGCDYHSNLTLHRKMADQVIAQIKAVTGWP